MRVAPSRLLLWLVAAIGIGALIALIARAPLPLVALVTAHLVAMLLGAACADFILSRRKWRAANVRFTRQLPAAFAIGVERAVRATLAHDSMKAWWCELFDHIDSSVAAAGLPQRLV